MKPLKFSVLSHKDLLQYASKRHQVSSKIIVINNTFDEGLRRFNFFKNFDNGIVQVHQEDFDDISSTTGQVNPEDPDSRIDPYTKRVLYPMTNKQAKAILAFVDDLSQETDSVIVSCPAGVSRSAGVCAALMRIYNHSDRKIFNDPSYVPNFYCYSLVLKQALEEGYLYG